MGVKIINVAPLPPQEALFDLWLWGDHTNWFLSNPGVSIGLASNLIKVKVGHGVWKAAAVLPAGQKMGLVQRLPEGHT